MSDPKAPKPGTPTLTLELAPPVEAELLVDDDQETPDEGPILVFPCSEAELDEGIALALERAELRKENEQLKADLAEARRGRSDAEHALAQADANYQTLAQSWRATLRNALGHLTQILDGDNLTLQKGTALCAKARDEVKAVLTQLLSDPKGGIR